MARNAGDVCVVIEIDIKGWEVEALDEGRHAEGKDGETDGDRDGVMVIKANGRINSATQQVSLATMVRL